MKKNIFTQLFFLGLIILNISNFLFCMDNKMKKPDDNILPAGKIAVFYPDNFPSADIKKISKSLLEESLEGFDYKFIANIDDLKSELNNSVYNLLILPFGSAFPADAWPEIRNFLSCGGNFINIGGSPFHQPVFWLDHKTEKKANGEKTEWNIGNPQPTYAYELLIGPADEINLKDEFLFPGSKRISFVEDSDFRKFKFEMPDKVYEMTCRFARARDFEKEDGTAGPRDASLKPLIHIIDENNIPIACPALEIDRLLGSEAGGRWIFLNSDAIPSSGFLKAVTQRALEGSYELNIRPIKASINKGENPSFRVIERNLGKNVSVNKFHISIIDAKNKTIYAQEIRLNGAKEFRTAEVIPESKNLSPGFYTVCLETADKNHHPGIKLTGFWVKDEKLLNNSPKLSVSRDWILKDKKVFPVIGTTYMASDVHRKFLFEPNPYIWDKDFAVMKSQGVNFVRTGIWTGWSRAMLDPGAIDENILKALDAYVQCAAKHEIMVCFNFFAFAPPNFGGVNPYLDTRALEGQKAFITLITERYKNIHWIHYDLINEPSYTPADKPWQNLPINDVYEKWAWKKWITTRHSDDENLIRNRWRESSQYIYDPPSQNEFYYSGIRYNQKRRKAADFNLFTQDVITYWADSLKKIIKESAGDVPVTLGQDEGGTETRPQHQFFYKSVDYTSVHTWWKNDDLLWDGICTKVPEKPNLIQETGLMRLENIDGEPWRNPEQASKLLERKFAYAFASKGCGVVQWAWNINPFMPVDNESVIGFFRPDGTAKPELRVLREYAGFFNSAKPYLNDFEPDKVVIVLPHSRLFAGRPNSLDIVKRLVHTISDKFGVSSTALSEYKLSYDRIKDAKLIIVPSAEMLDDSAASVLFQASQKDIKILFTGSIEGNLYGESGEWHKKLGLTDPGIPVSFYEFSNWKSGNSKYITFERSQSEFLKKSTIPFLNDLSGNIWHEPLPLELAREDEPLINLLSACFTKAGIEFSLTADPITTRILITKDIALVVMVNESNKDGKREIAIDKFKYDISVKGQRSRLILIDRKNGNIIVKNEGEVTVINKKGDEK
jgi:hypothetical protein